MTITSRSFLVFTVAWLVLVGGCARMPSTGRTALRPAGLNELSGYLLSHKPELDEFRLRGPFEVKVQKDFVVRLSDAERFTADLYLAAPAGKAPLVIYLHGQDNSKDDHAYQAQHLATWGMHGLVLQLPNQGPWIENGKILARIVALIRAQPGLIDNRIDTDRIVLAGHSFGGSAVTVALAEGARATGGVLLDPAGVGKSMPGILRKVNAPIMVIASDPNVTRTRQRGYFYEYIRSNIAEVSIVGAHHEDAQFAFETPADSDATEALQVTFVSALTAAAFSLGFTGNLDYAWASFKDGLGSGKLLDSLRK